MVKCSQAHIAAAFAVLTGLSVAGCGQRNWGYLSGTVTLNGEAVGPGTITFEPLESGRGGAMATFGEDGAYSVMSSGRKEGARVGAYRALIHGGENFGEEVTGAQPKSKIPARYARPNSDLTVQIEPGKNTFDFDLKP